MDLGQVQREAYRLRALGRTLSVVSLQSRILELRHDPVPLHEIDSPACDAPRTNTQIRPMLATLRHRRARGIREHNS